VSPQEVHERCLRGCERGTHSAMWATVESRLTVVNENFDLVEHATTRHYAPPSGPTTSQRILVARRLHGRRRSASHVVVRGERGRDYFFDWYWRPSTGRARGAHCGCGKRGATRTTDMPGLGSTRRLSDCAPYPTMRQRSVRSALFVAVTLVHIEYCATALQHRRPRNDYGTDECQHAALSPGNSTVTASDS
jgi:hypothetical protein